MVLVETVLQSELQKSRRYTQRGIRKRSKRSELISMSVDSRIGTARLNVTSRVG